ncbi:hypothetical protein NVP1152O_005 [Vibrio phage 1.152.O._10N.222.46.E1]|uniref:Uncharacterized protein n=5 Tax=Nahantvirus 49C7 TaxID=2846601 RepID=A0A2I7RB75_9CAUD|nr:hypothetical protein HYP57_gp005 [Vibrio phage 1.026.O._10N.222.49.C7]AUR82488.1 hypothetical protein NVP1025O_005 [Vibrio phage 1.025.O._10N.222.46.B6]AUR90738.1 hypothetical protein NVP1150O_005 [Vibrio phage 1.150.O._10N.222.46.A6]AUR90910.1 hypothetical protein NVP1152O_005 [Vibrio phage 1.152.O._10N.222.46.E1]AUS02379.1 hypothetical protein NVP2130O_005 [Vibrio phage 2.130.O._10N.222.46.C2]AUR82596.1 hypothetical protein NVP1026O_005 [Vibrio phage 1.026.O._10N.222.49.C7]
MKLQTRLFKDYESYRCFGRKSLLLKLCWPFVRKSFAAKFAIDRLTHQLMFQRTLHLEYKKKYHSLHKEHNKYLALYGEAAQSNVDFDLPINAASAAHELFMEADDD